MNESILYVDDDEMILAAYRRYFRNRWKIETATGGTEGLRFIENKGPFAVVISDMQMPEMDGIEFLSAVKKLAPDTVRMMLTGHAELTTAMDAVNEGNIFRFLTKPCKPETLEMAIQAGLRQYRLITSERDLLKNTLSSSIKVLIELLGIVNPMAFSRANRIKRYVRQIVGHLKLENSWQYEIAAMLSQIGSVTLPLEIIDKLYSNMALEAEEEVMYNAYPETSYKLIANIPRLEKIAMMIKHQNRPYSDYQEQEISDETATANLGAQILKVALDLDQYVFGGIDVPDAFGQMKRNQGVYNPTILDAIERINTYASKEKVRIVNVSELHYGMIAQQDIKTPDGRILVAKGMEITYPIIAHLKNVVTSSGAVGQFKMLVPA